MGNNVIVTCQLCGKKIDRRSLEANCLTLADRGGRSAYLCEHCTQVLNSYYDKNTQTYGTPKANGKTYSIELESELDTLQARVELFHKKFLPTRDCTVQIEYKSPIYQGLNSLIKHCESIENLNNKGYIDTLNENCGCHIHYGTFDDDEKDTLRDVWAGLFGATQDMLALNMAKTSEFFGRYFDDDYACYIENAHSRYNWFSCATSAPTIELRIAKFINADQYARVIRYGAKIADILKAYTSGEKTIEQAKKAIYRTTHKFIIEGWHGRVNG